MSIIFHIRGDISARDNVGSYIDPSSNSISMIFLSSALKIYNNSSHNPGFINRNRTITCVHG